LPSLAELGPKNYLGLPEPKIIWKIVGKIHEQVANKFKQFKQFI
jgi:hypothetical protein